MVYPIKIRPWLTRICSTSRGLIQRSCIFLIASRSESAKKQATNKHYNQKYKNFHLIINNSGTRPKCPLNTCLS